MKLLTRHLTKCIIAGVVAILPIGGLVLTVAYLEYTIASSGISQLPFYFPGLGLLASVVLIYLIGLTVTNFIGKWLWGKVDVLINSLPALGKLYISIKQILGYGDGEDAVFRDTVLVPAQGGAGEELGLVTNEISLPDGTTQMVVFVPGSPNPTIGRLIIVDRESVKPIEMSVNMALKALVAVGKSEMSIA